MRYPAGPAPEMPERFVGRPTIDAAKCPADCRQCAAACPTAAVTCGQAGHRLQLDMGRCLFCRQCETACGRGAIRFSRDHRLAASRREDLILAGATRRAAVTLDDVSRRLFGRSLKLRQVSAGGCNACEADTNVLGTVAWDLGRFGIQFVASPRHADGLLITGPVPENMRLALIKTYAAVPHTEAGDRGWFLRDFRRTVCRSPRGPPGRSYPRARRSICARLPAAPPQYSRRSAFVARPYLQHYALKLVCSCPTGFQRTTPRSRNAIMDGLPTAVYWPVKARPPVSCSTRKAVTTSLR